jgi:hypothetical protein
MYSNNWPETVWNVTHWERIQNVLGVQGTVLLIQDGVVVRGPVADFVVRVHAAAGQEHEDRGQQVVAQSAKLGQGRHRRGPHRRVLQDDAVVDEPDVPGRFTNV